MTRPQLTRTLLLAAGALGFGVLAVFLLQRPARHSLTPFQGVVESAEKITLRTGPVELNLYRDSSTWTVNASSGGPLYRADTDKIRTLQMGLRRLQLEDVVTRHTDRAGDFCLNADSATAVTLFGKNGARLAEGIFGKEADDAVHLYFRFPDKPDVYIGRGSGREQIGDAELKPWRDRTITNLTEDQVLTVVIDGPGYKTALARSSDTWSVNGRVVDPPPVWGMLGMLTHLRAEDFVDLAKYPKITRERLTYATVLLQFRDGTVHELHIGTFDNATHFYPVAVDADPNVYWAAEGNVKAFLRKPSDFGPKR